MGSILDKKNKRLTPITATALKALDIQLDGGWGGPFDRLKYNTNHYALNPEFEWGDEDQVQEMFDVMYFPKQFQGIVVDVWPVDVRGCIVAQLKDGGPLMAWPVNSIEGIQGILRRLLKFVEMQDGTEFLKLPNKPRPLTREEIDNRKPKRSFYTKFHGNENEVMEYISKQQLKRRSYIR